MKHTNIAAVLGWESPEDLSEGLHLQPEEAATIDKKLGEQAANETAAADLAAANEKVTKLEGELATANTNLQTANDRVTELEAENKKLGAESSGKGTTLTTTEDEATKESGNKKVTLNSPEHPLNVLAARKVAAGKVKK
ncbi:MAG TPA: hypothetical protein VEB42_12015 [Chitinophagaceae bacterium]|nr:hypothetical protein [Chitinophagaceae bacterium]